MVGIYFSGTGNTKHCVEKFVGICNASEGRFEEKEQNGELTAFSIEDELAIEAIKNSDIIVFGYPTYYSNLPKIVRDFVENNKECFNEKKVYVLVTMGMFSGDGAGYLARVLQKCGATIVGGLHLKMPDCIGDVNLLKKSLAKNQHIVKMANRKIVQSANRFIDENPTQEGLGLPSHIAGLFGQRLWFNGKTKYYSNKLKIDKSKCVACGKCVSLCPMKNLKIENAVVLTSSRCTMCYRCISNCPNQAITLLGKKVVEQSRFENYVSK